MGSFPILGLPAHIEQELCWDHARENGWFVVKLPDGRDAGDMDQEEIRKAIEDACPKDQIDSLRQALRDEIERRGLHNKYQDMISGPPVSEAPGEYLVPHGRIIHKLDFAEISAGLERFRKAAQETGEAIVTASQALADIEIEPLSETELTKAKWLEDFIEAGLEKEYDPKNPHRVIEIAVPQEHPLDERIIDWLAERYPAWDMEYVGGQFNMTPNDKVQ